MTDKSTGSNAYTHNPLLTHGLLVHAMVGVLLGNLALCGYSAEFLPLGDLPGGDFDSKAMAVSGDGTAVVGYSRAADGENEAFRWTEETGLAGLGAPPPAALWSLALGVSSDGTVVVGAGKSRDEPVSQEAFRWTEEQRGMVGLGDLPGAAFWSRGEAVSGDGSVVVGGSFDRFTSDGNQPDAFRWTQEDGMAPLLVRNRLPSEFRGIGSSATATSHDGAIIVGASQAFGEGIAAAWRWAESSGIVQLEGLHNAVWTQADDITPDGSLIVGTSGSTGRRQPVRWTENTGIEPLEPWTGNAYDSHVSADGSVVVGSRSSPLGAPWIWDEQHGVRDLQQVLRRDYGLSGELQSWRLEGANDISDDGLRIVGHGTNSDGKREAWLVILDPPLQAGDADRDGDFDQLDLVKVLTGAKYLTDQTATWGEGDWNGAPGGLPLEPPIGDGLFNQLDIVVAQQNGLYLAGPYGTVVPNTRGHDGHASLGYSAPSADPANIDLVHVPLPEPSGIDLLITALIPFVAIVRFRRRR